MVSFVNYNWCERLSIWVQAMMMRFAIYWIWCWINFIWKNEIVCCVRVWFYPQFNSLLINAYLCMLAVWIFLLFFFLGWAQRVQTIFMLLLIASTQHNIWYPSIKTFMLAFGTLSFLRWTLSCYLVIIMINEWNFLHHFWGPRKLR